MDQVLGNAQVDRRQTVIAIDKLLDEAGVDAAVRVKSARTLLILLVLRAAFAEQQPIWQRAFKKSASYIADVAGVNRRQVQTWLDEIEAATRKPA